MKNSIINACMYILAIVIMAIVFFVALMWATAPEQWYAGQHDSLHEGANCDCYNRLVNSANNK